MRISLTASGFDVEVVPVKPPVEPEDLVDAVLLSRPDMVVLDLDLGPAGDGAALIPLFRAGECRVLVLTANRDLVRWGECLARGALAVMSKSEQLGTLVDTMLAALRGAPTMANDDRERLIAQWHEWCAQHDEGVARLGRLSPREQQVLEQLVRGLRVRQIAERSVVSEATVRTQVKSILAKLNVSSQIAAVALAREARSHRQHDALVPAVDRLGEGVDR